MKRNEYINDVLQDQQDLDEFDQMLLEETRKVELQKQHSDHGGTTKSSEPTRKELAQSFRLAPKLEEDLHKRMKPGKIYNANHSSTEGTGIVFVGGVRPPKPSGATRKSSKKTARRSESR